MTEAIELDEEGFQISSWGPPPSPPSPPLGPLPTEEWPGDDDRQPIDDDDGGPEPSVCDDYTGPEPSVYDDVYDDDGAGNPLTSRKKLAAAAVGATAALAICLGLGFGLGGSGGGDAIDARTVAAISSENGEVVFDAVVIGAGWAGIRAIETLVDSGVESAIVLEASGRVGGRAWSVNSDGTENNPDADAPTVPYDLGAEFNYDSGINWQQNVLYDAGSVPDEVWDNGNYAVWPTWPGWAAYYQQTRDDDTGEVVTKRLDDAEDRMQRIWDPFLEFRESRLDRLAGSSYGEAIQRYARKKGLADEESLQFLNLVDANKHLEYGNDYGPGSTMDITEIEFTDPTFHVETVYMGVPGVGWGNVAADYAQRFSSRIRLNSRVTEINSEKDSDYAVISYEEDGVVRVVRAKAVLVTVSVGVLKAGNINFVPSLTAKKRRSIDAMGFGLINKCIMSWKNEEDLVWPKDDLWFLLATPDDETSGRWTTFSNPSKFKGVPSLTAWIGGKGAADAEMKGDDEVLDEVMANLRAMFPSIREPDDVIITRWGREENVLGAYSYPTPGEDFYADLNNIRQRQGKIYFAGEATSSNGWATTFGAWDSGEAMASRMAASLTAD